MQPEQKEVFYLTGESLAQVGTSPHLEAFRAKGIEVLYLIDPVDELLVQTLPEFQGKKLKSIGKGTVALGSEEERKEAEASLKEREEALKPLLDALQQRLDEHVKQVRLTNRLTSSPVCLVGAEHDYSPQLERLLQKGKGGGPKQRRILELNPQHEVLARLEERFARDATDPLLDDYADLLLGYGLIAEGSELPDPARFNQAVAKLLVRSS
jgi:molecular chaperone HtpG